MLGLEFKKCNEINLALLGNGGGGMIIQNLVCGNQSSVKRIVKTGKVDHSGSPWLCWLQLVARHLAGEGVCLETRED